MYINAMNAPTEISITQARSELAEVIDRARMNHEPVYLMRHGQRVAAIVDSSDLARLLELAEDMNDILEARTIIERSLNRLPLCSLQIIIASSELVKLSKHTLKELFSFCIIP